MALFADAGEVYAQIGALFEEAVADERLGARIRGSELAFRLRLRAPDAQITIKALAAQPAQVTLGESTDPAEVVLSMDADAAHRLWLGELNVATALEHGEIRARGPAAKVLSVIALVKPLSERYRARLDAAGRGDLIASGAEAGEQPDADAASADSQAAAEPEVAEAAAEPEVAEAAAQPEIAEAAAQPEVAEAAAEPVAPEPEPEPAAQAPEPDGPQASDAPAPEPDAPQAPEDPSTG